MAKISLRMYNREIEGLVEQQRLEEAIAHCRQILKTFPKHLETYRLLGKAYLEAKRYDQAVDIFQRILVAAPDDFVSHVGMSIISDDKGKLDDAIWHMERAFEVQPSNAAIQGELQRLFGRRDGIEPPKIRLTRGALAHMYVQGELYNQAISEIRAVLSSDPQRTDMQTLLARAYFRNGQKAEASEICSELIARYLYCLDANRLMAEILPGTQHPEAAQDYRDRVVELDPYAAFSQDGLFHSDKVADSAVSLERLEYMGETAETPPVLGLGLESDTASNRLASGTLAASKPGGTGDLPAWLSGVADETGPSQAPSAPAAPAARALDDIPPFLRDAGWGAAAASSEPAASPFDEPLGAVPPEGGAVEGDLPEWVKALAPPEDNMPTGPTPPMSPPMGEPAMDLGSTGDEPDWLRDLGAPVSEPLPGTPAASGEPATTSFGSDMPDWLREMGPAEPAASAPSAQPDDAPDWLKSLGGRELDQPSTPEPPAPPAAEPQQPAEQVPDWLDQFRNDLETPVTKTEIPAPPPIEPPAAAAAPSAGLGALGTSAQEQDDAMAWLESLAAKHGAKPEELVTDPNARTDVAPDWVDKARAIGDQPTEPTTAPATDDTAVWLRGLESETGSIEVEPRGVDEEQAFELSDAATAEAASIEPQAEAEIPASSEAETPSWLSDFAAKPTESSMTGDMPDWLRGLEQENEQETAPAASAEAQAPAEQPQAPQEAEPAEPAGDLATWLAGLEQQESMNRAETGAASSDELPAWLQAESEPEPEAKEPARPTDWHPVQSRPAETVQPPIEVKPAAQELEPPPPAPARPVRPVAESAQTAPLPPMPSRAAEPAPKASAPSRPRAASAAKPSPLSIGDAQVQLGRGNIAAALDIYGKLIRKGKALEDIIRDLRDALYRYPVEVPLWQSLGDAYMRANRLQEALDAYTKAEELLR